MYVQQLIFSMEAKININFLPIYFLSEDDHEMNDTFTC